MKSVFLIAVLMIAGCGYSSRNNEVIGQAKKVVQQTPILCNDRTDVDVSLGVMRNGVGSMSSQDLWFTVPREEDRLTLLRATAEGSIVKVTYDIKRTTFCWIDHIITKVEIVK